MDNVILNNSLENHTTIKIQRQTNFELLRIICMLLIVAHHFACHGGYAISKIPQLNAQLINGLIVGGKLGVNVFVLISGYFMIESKFKFSKLLRLVSHVVFYSVLFYLLEVILNRQEFNIWEFFVQFFANCTSRYWFASCYVILFILSPYLNKMIKACDKKQHLLLIAILLFIQTILPKFYNISYFGNTFWFITVYIIATYFRLYSNKIFDNVWIMLGGFLITLFVMVFANINGLTLWGLKNVTCVICSVCIFCLFKNINVGKIKIINFISSATYGVYLLHDNNFTRPFIWRELLNCPARAFENSFPLFALCAILGVFAVCTVIELARKYSVKLFEILLKKLIKKNV